MPTTAAPNRALPFVDWYLLPESFSTQLVGRYIAEAAMETMVASSETSGGL